MEQSLRGEGGGSRGVGMAHSGMWGEEVRIEVVGIVDVGKRRGQDVQCRGCACCTYDDDEEC